MGQRQRKSHLPSKRRLRPEGKKRSVATAAKVEKSMADKLLVSTEKKNDTITGIDFFGFSPKIFAKDLKKTAWATAVIVVILVIIYVVAAKGV